ncbi:MAG: hypothetical protein GEU83_19995 [Pseudonocardiaceae bacterium]|nr:hypothetical protein [Pseudonocardiaceae bacterium]
MPEPEEMSREELQHWELLNAAVHGRRSGQDAPAARKRRDGPQRPKGTQPGAPGANLAWVERPGDRQDRFPQGHCECGHDLADATDLEVTDRYQQHEIPQVSVKVT